MHLFIIFVWQNVIRQENGCYLQICINQICIALLIQIENLTNIMLKIMISVIIGTEKTITHDCAVYVRGQSDSINSLLMLIPLV